MTFLKMAYDTHGNRVPYNSKGANVSLRIRGNTIQIEHRGLPSIEYFSYGGHEVVRYLPRLLARQIESDIKDFQLDVKLGIIMSLPLPEENARSFARSMEELYKNMPPATDCALLSSRVSW